MKRKITKEDLLAIIDELDTRAKKLSSKVKDRIINNGFAELSTVSSPFIGEMTVDLSGYYEMGETKIEILIPVDVEHMYDLYLIRQAQDPFMFKHGEQKIRNDSIIWKDAKNSDIVHIDLNANVNGEIYELAKISYFYLPTADFEQVFIGSDVYIALQYAIESSAYDMLHDVEKAGQKRSGMTRTAATIKDVYPQDYNDPGKPSMFPPGV